MTPRTFTEVIADTVDEAVQQGLDELGVGPDDVSIEVLDAGTRGLFGLGTRQARVRLILKGSQKPDEQPVPDASASISEPEEDEFEYDDDYEDEGDEDDDANWADYDDLDDTLLVARDTVEELLEKMHVPAGVTVYYGEKDPSRDLTPIYVDIHGSDLSILIGKRAETLYALQYIAGLMISRQLGEYTPVIIDIEGYRSRRAKQLAQLANRMADQVVKTGRRLALEPMPASERRLIHMELRNRDDVYTESVGEEPYRKLTIIPKE